MNLNGREPGTRQNCGWCLLRFRESSPIQCKAAGWRCLFHTFSALVALVLGIATAVCISTWWPSVQSEATAVANVVGTLWFNAVRMTVIPLVMSLLITSVVDARNGRLLSRLGKRTILAFMLLLISAAVLAAVLTSVALPLLPNTVTVIRQPTSIQSSQPSIAPGDRMDLAQWFVTLIPANPFKAAVDGAMLPLLIFSVAFAIALHRVRIGLRESLLNSFRAIAEAMLIVLNWVSLLAPLGVFSLSLALIADASISVVGALGIDVVLLCSVLLLTTAAVFAVGVVGGAVPLQRLVDAIAPALVIAFTSRSSMAALPVLMRSVHERLSFNETTTGLLLPFAASVLRVSAPVAQTVAALFVAHAFSIVLVPMQILTLPALAVMLSFAVPGIPTRVS